ncbi:hypothetical protein CEXT_518531 [Caerostris extrusa]|uniref:Uncharacterized protein n=1 Tax=Caerostris extrusa TaxID=172846 RepID=A0AAV4TUU2_CAEEX|nr:hypothetical protein CEXT_518531 [Caerostris extrusa]
MSGELNILHASSIQIKIGKKNLPCERNFPNSQHLNEPISVELRFLFETLCMEMQIKIFIANLLESNPEATPPDVSFGANRPLKERFQDVTRRRNPSASIRGFHCGGSAWVEG